MKLTETFIIREENHVRRSILKALIYVVEKYFSSQEKAKYKSFIDSLKKADSTTPEDKMYANISDIDNDLKMRLRALFDVYGAYNDDNKNDYISKEDEEKIDYQFGATADDIANALELDKDENSDFEEDDGWNDYEYNWKY